MLSKSSQLGTFFGVALRAQTYRNALYLILAFPLGLAYFVFLVTGLALGLGLSIVLIGLGLLALMVAAWYGLAAFERQMAIWLLREEIPPMTRADLAASAAERTLWQRSVGALTNPVTWKGLFFLAAKFPLGILSFVIVVTLLSVSAALIGSPFYYPYASPQMGWMIVDTPLEAALAVGIGLVVLFLSLHVFNGLAWFSGKFARVMLGNFQPVPASAPTPPPAPLPAAEIVPPQVYETARTLDESEDRGGAA